MSRITVGMRQLVVLLMTLAVAACGGGGGGSSGGYSPPPPSPPPPPPQFGPNFSEIQTNVFTPSCATSGCHSGPAAPEGLQLDAANSYGLLVDVPSNQNGAILRVAPGDPDNSYLIMKLEGNAGVQMPAGQPPLSSAVINTIRQWITDGAIDDRVQSTDPIRVTSLSPVPGSTVMTSPTEIIAMFDRDPDPSTVNANTFLVLGSGGDGDFTDGDEVPVTADSISVSGTNTSTVTFALNAALTDDTYQVTLSGSGASMILDMDANALDGEFTGTFPSGDGTQGGDFVAAFTVQSQGQQGQTLDDIQANVFTPNCSSAGCHSGGGGSLPTSMNLTSADFSFAALVGVTSIQEAPLLRVAPGDPDNSYLIRKLEGNQVVGGRMPAIGPPLDQAVIDGIRQWISDGATRQ